ncbi:MAG: LptF/LptG family permease [Bacteroidaceae bacterium]|nr:LptF/LptG family permease [Bacteroidaceae bacterium]
MRPKKLDIFILRSFLLLFAGAFFVCLFILLMNVLWRYIEDLVGKGFTLDVIIKFFYYFSLTLVPMALPLAVLLASLITFGNFGERFELLAMKTAGASLLRIMRPLIIFCTFLAGLSFYFQNVVGPNASRKLYSLVFSMQQKSPELQIPEGVFYNQIEGFNLYVKHKNPDTGMLYDVTIYDISEGYENISVIVADSGKLETTADKQHLFLRIYSGEMFENMQEQQMSRSDNPYRRESFAEKHILIEFDSDFTMVDENVMSSQAASKNMKQIRYDIDSLSAQQDSVGLGNLSDYRTMALNTVKLSSSDSAKFNASTPMLVNSDSIFMVSSRSDQLEIRKAMQAKIQSQKSELTLKGTNMFYNDRNIRKHWIQWMQKITQSLSIIIFFFIGAPLGAIIRKGGLGVPVLVSVMTFIIFYITSSAGEKMFREGEWSIVGCWLSTIILTPFSIFFTVKANADSTIFQLDVYKEFFRYWFGGKQSRNIVRKEVIIEEPDDRLCSDKLQVIAGESSNLSSIGLFNGLPNYLNLFFRDVDSSRLDTFGDGIEEVINELSNSRDKVVLNMINKIPIMPVYGIEPPFKKAWFNRVVGVVLPLGLLFYLRAWFFSIYLKKHINTITEVTSELAVYLKEKDN